MPPKAQILYFQSFVIKLNLIGPNILLFEYFGLKNNGEKIIKSQN
jgi:hypothetical protein